MPPLHHPNKVGGHAKNHCVYLAATAIQSADVFGSSFSLRISNERDDEIKSGLGTCCSLILLLITAVYGLQKMIVLVGRDDTLIRTII